MTELNEYMEISFTHRIENLLEQCVRLQFPLIKDFTIENNSGMLTMTFTTGATKQEVETFLDTLKARSR